MSDMPIFRALVVDDEDAVRRLTVLALRRRGIVCIEAVDGVEAMPLLAAFDYDVVVTDMRMPNCHGHELTKRILDRPQPRPAVIVLTGVAEPRLAEDLLTRGVDLLEFKPVDYRVFAAKVEKILRDRHAQSPTASNSTDESEGVAAGMRKRGIVLEAALRVLQEADRPLSAREIVQVSSARGYWRTADERTALATLSGVLQRELTAKGDESRIRKTPTGEFERRAT